MKAEIYREIGEFETARNILDSVDAEEDFLKSLISQIQERIKNNDCRVFQIKQDIILSKEKNRVVSL